MATTIQKILDIQVNYNQAIQGIAEYNRQLEVAKKFEKDLNDQRKKGSIGEQEYRERIAASKQETAQINNAKRLLEKTTRDQITAQRAEEGSLEQLRAQLRSATQEYDRMSAAERNGARGHELKDKINSITTELKGAEEETQRFYRNVGNYKDAQVSLDNLSNSVSNLGKQMMALAGITSIGALAKQAEQVGTAYADQMGKVLAVTNANTVEFAQMSAEVERLGATTRYTAQEAGAAMEFLTRNGLPAVEATNTLEGVLHLAQANAIELAEAADIVTGQMNAFHLKVADVTRINDVLSYTCAHSATNILQLNEALRNTAPIAYTAGVSIEETSAALGTLADNNIKGSDAGTILKQTFNGLITSTQKTKQVYAELGIEMNDSVVKAKGLTGALEEIMSKGPSIQQLSDIFGRRAVPGVLALTNSLDKLKEKFGELTDSSLVEGTTDRMFKQSYSQFTLAAKTLQSAWESFLIQVWQGTDNALREKFVAEADKLDEEFLPRIEHLKEEIKKLNDEATEDPSNDAVLNDIRAKQQEMSVAESAYLLAKEQLSQQMEIESKHNEQLTAWWEEAAQGIENTYMPKIEGLRAELESLNERQALDSDNAELGQEIAAKTADLNEATEEYVIARNLLMQEAEVVNTGDEDLIQRWRDGANAIDSEYLPKLDALKEKVEGLRAKAEQNPANEQIAEDLKNSEQQLNDAYNAYEGARNEFQDSMSEEIAEKTDFGGLSGVLQKILEDATSLVQFVKQNLDEISNLVVAVIGGISLTKLIEHVRTSAGTMKTSLITNAEQASAKVKTLAYQERSELNRIKQLEVVDDKMSDQEKLLNKQKLEVERAKLAETRAALEKAKTAEITAYEQAAAVSTATGWKGAMTAAGIAVKGFVTTAKTAMKSFAPMLVISLVIELVMKLWDALNSGKGPIGNIGKAIGSFIKNSLNTLIKVVVDVINWFIEFYNDSIVVRGAIALLGGVFKAVWTVLKAGIASIGNSFKLLGNIIAGVANTLKALFTLDLSGVKNGIGQIGNAVADFYKDQKQNAIEAGKDIVDGFVSSFEGMDDKLEKVEFKPVSSGGGSPKGGKGGSSNVNTTDTNIDLGDLGSGSGGKGGKGRKGGSGGKGGNNKEEDPEKLADERAKAFEDAEKELQKYVLQLMGETAEMRKKKIEDQYDNEYKAIQKKIEDAKALYAKDPNMSAAEKKKIDDMIHTLTDALEKNREARQRALDIQAQEEITRANKLDEEILKAKLDNIKRSGEAEIEERNKWQKEQLLKQQESEEAALLKRKLTGEISETQYQELLAQIKEKFRIQNVQLEEKHQQDLQAVQKKALQAQIDALKLAQSEEELGQAILHKNLQYGTDEFYAAELSRLKGFHREKVEEDYLNAKERKEQLYTEGNERLAAIIERGQLEGQTEAEFLAEQQAAKDEYYAQRLASDEEFRNQVNEVNQEMYEAQRAIDDEMVQQQLERLDAKQAAILGKELEAAEQNLENLRARGQLETQTQEEFEQELTNAKQQYANARAKINDAEVKNEQAKAQAMKAVTQGLCQLLDQLGDENSAFAKMSKIIALAQIAIDTGKALAAGISSASELPYPANLVAIATTVATILANVATAISTVKSAKFAQGGKVTGPGTGTSDDIPAMLSNGEFVMNARSTRLFEPLLTAMNNIGRGVPIQVANSYQPISGAEMMTASFTEAAQEIRPVVSVVDVTDMQNKVEVIQNLDTF